MPVKQVYTHYQRQRQTVSGFKHCPFCGTNLILPADDHPVRPTCAHCGFIQYKNPAPSISILVLDKDRVLLGKRLGDPGKGTWALPSGYIEYEDDFLTAAIRETREETGLDVEILSLINVVSSFVSPRFHFLGVYVTARVVGGELEARDDLETVAWFPIAGPLPEMGFQEDATIIDMVANRWQGLPVDPAFATANS